VQKRHELALMLGYSSYSEMVLEPRMAKTPMMVQQFEDDLTHRISGMVLRKWRDSSKLRENKPKTQRPHGILGILLTMPIYTKRKNMTLMKIP